MVIFAARKQEQVWVFNKGTEGGIMLSYFRFEGICGGIETQLCRHDGAPQINQLVIKIRTSGWSSQEQCCQHEKHQLCVAKEEMKTTLCTLNTPYCCGIRKH